MTRSIVVDGVETVADYRDVTEEVEVLRRGVGLSVLPHVTIARVSGADARSFLDTVLPSDLLLRDGQVRATLVLDESGEPLADAYVCNDDDRYLLFAEGMPRGPLLDHLRAHVPTRADVTIEDLRESHALLSLNGPFAWELLAELEGRGVIGFPYLSFYHAGDGRLLLRGGKTGEFGYDLLVPSEHVATVTDRIREAGRRFDLASVGVEALWRCALENWFYNPHRQRATGVTPIELGLQWRVSRRKEFVGSAALAVRRATSMRRRATAISSPVPLTRGDVVTFEGVAIGTILDAHECALIDRTVALAMLDLPYAHSGIDRFTIGGTPVRTTSPPFVDNLSLHVNPQRDSYATRAEIAFPGFGRLLQAGVTA